MSSAPAARAKAAEDGRFFHLIGDAILVTPDYTVRADTISRDRRDSTGEAFGHVRIMEPGASNLVTGDHAFFDQRQDLAVVDRNPVMTSRESEGDLLESTAEIMSFYRAENRVVMVDSVAHPPGPDPGRGRQRRGPSAAST